MEAAHVELSTDVSTSLHDFSARMNQMSTSHAIKVLRPVSYANAHECCCDFCFVSPIHLSHFA
jgi:hypothetical protein